MAETAVKNPPKPTAKREQYYKLMAGNYSPMLSGRKVVRYRADGSGAGSIVKTDRDLTELNPPNPKHRKFERVTESEAKRIMRVEAAKRKAEERAAEARKAGIDEEFFDEDDLAEKEDGPEAGAVNVMATVEAMTLEEIRKWAAAEEIDLKGAKTKDEAVKAVRAAGIK